MFANGGWLENNKLQHNEFNGQLSETKKIIFYNDMLWKARATLDALASTKSVQNEESVS